MYSERRFYSLIRVLFITVTINLNFTPTLSQPQPLLSPLDACVLVLQRTKCSIHHFLPQICPAINAIDGSMLTNLWHEIIYRWDICRVTKGSRFERFSIIALQLFLYLTTIFNVLHLSIPLNKSFFLPKLFEGTLCITVLCYR